MLPMPFMDMILPTVVPVWLSSKRSRSTYFIVLTKTNDQLKVNYRGQGTRQLLIHSTAGKIHNEMHKFQHKRK